jgi:hypothetical protein
MKLFFVLFFLVIPIVAHAQFTSIRDIDLSAKYITQKTEGNGYRLVYKIARKNSTSSVFRKIEFDGTLRPTDTVEITFSENFRVLAVAKGIQYEVYAFGSLQTGKIRFVWVDLTTGKQHQTLLNRMGWWSKKNKVTLLSTSNAEVFCVTHQLDNRTTEIQFISPTGKGQVIKKIAPGKRVEIKDQYLLGDKLIFIVATEVQSDKKIKYQVMAFNAATSKELYTKEISNKGSMFAADQIKNIDHTIYFLGRRYPSKKISHTKPGLASLVSVDMNTGKANEMRINGTAPFTTWVDIVKSDSASVFLVGETFKSGTYGGYFAKAMATGILTLGIVSVRWNALNFKDVVLVEMKKDEQQRQERIELFPRRVQVGYFLPAYAFASHLTRTGQSRYFGTNNSYLYLRNGDVMTAHVLHGKGTKDIAMVREETSPATMHIMGESAIMVRKRPFEKTLDLEVISFPRLP